MPEPGELEKMLLEIPGDTKIGWLTINNMLTIANAVVYKMAQYHKEKGGEEEDAYIVLDQAYREIPVELYDVRKIDEQEGE